MNDPTLASNTAARAAADALFERAAPVLVEVRFPGMGTSSDWHLFDDADQLDALLDTLGPRVEIHLTSVWAMKATKATVRLTK